MKILFNDLPISQETKDALAKMNLIEPTPIQEQAIPKMIEGLDIIGQAQTGTGKTFSYAIPVLEKLDFKSNKVQVLILCPTRELTIQVYKEILKLVKFNSNVKVATIYGGESITKQFKELSKKPQIIVGTPGRVIDHMTRKTLDFSNLQILVLDEADEMLKMGFQEDLEKILIDTPKERQTVLFSATMPAFIKKIAKKYQKNPFHIEIESQALTVDKIEQFFYEVKKQDKLNLLIRVLDFYNPNSSIIFCNTKRETDEINEYLQENGYESDALHGDLKQNQRDQVMQKFRSHRLKLLIATDVAARGLDVSDVEIVINVDLPNDNEVYVHRIGRTGRAGKSGISLSFATNRTRYKITEIEKFTQSKMTFKQVPTIDEINKNRLEKVILNLQELINNNKSVTNDAVITKLLETNTETEIINGLLNEYIKPTKEYDTISNPGSSSSRDKRDGRDSGRGRDRDRDSSAGKKRNNEPRKDHIFVSINLGKSDKITPVQLVDYLKKNLDLYPKHVGDIKIREKETTFEIHRSAAKRLESIDGKFFNGKKLKISQAQSL